MFANARNLTGHAWIAVISVAFSLSACSRGAEPVDVVLSLDKDTVGISRLVLSIDYSTAGARPVISRGEPACTTLLPFITTKFSDDGAGRLSMQAFSSTSFSAPLDLAACRMIPQTSGLTGKAIAAALRIEVVEALDSSGNPLSERKLASAAASTARRNVDGTIDESLRKRKTPREDLAIEDGEPAPRGNRTAPAPSAPTGTATRERVRDGRIDERAADTQRAAPGVAPRVPPTDTQPPLVLGGGGSTGSGAAGSGDGGESDNGGGGGGGSAPVPDGGTAPIPYGVTIMVVGQYGDLGALQFDVEYLGPSGNFVGKADGVDCTSLVGAGLAAFTNKGNGKVTGAMVNVNGFPTPSLIARCTLKSRDIVTPDSFLVTATDASDTETTPLEEFPQMAVVEVVPLS